MALQYNPQHGILDFSGVTNALGDYTAGVNQAKRVEDWNALSSNMAGIDPAMQPFLRAAGPDKGPQMYMQARNRADDISHRNRSFDASRTDADRSFGLQQKQFGLSQAANSRAAAMHTVQMDQAKAQAEATAVQRIGGVAQIIAAEPDPGRQQQMWAELRRTHPRAFATVPQHLQDDPVNGARVMIALARGWVDPMDNRMKEAQVGLAEAKAKQALTGKGGAETTLQKEVDKARVEMAQKDIQSGQGANETIEVVRQLRELSEGGKLDGAVGPIGGTEEYQSIVGGLVPFSESLGLANRGGNAQIRRLQSQLELAGGEKMKGLGAQSDADAKRLSNAVAGLSFARNRQEFNAALAIIENSVKSAAARGQAAAREFPALGSRLVPNAVQPSGGKPSDPLGIR